MITKSLGNNHTLFNSLLPQLFSANQSAQLIATGELQYNNSDSVRAQSRARLTPQDAVRTALADALRECVRADAWRP